METPPFISVMKPAAPALEIIVSEHIEWWRWWWGLSTILLLLLVGMLRHIQIILARLYNSCQQEAVS